MASKAKTPKGRTSNLITKQRKNAELTEFIGDLGEDLFVPWCTKAELLATKPGRDRKGWDYYVEDNAKGRADEPLDVRPPEFSCKVQVKATTAGKRKISVKLDNWERAAKEPMPWFFVVYVFDDRVVQAAYIIHVGDKLIERVLKRLRQLETENDPKPLHKQTMSLTWTDRDRIDHREGAALRSFIQSHIGNDTLAYIQHKTEHQNTSGFDENPIRIAFTMPSMQREAAHELMADFAVGLVEDLPISALRKIESRFGIQREIQRLSGGEGTIRLQDRPSEGLIRVIFSDPDRTSVASISCNVYLAHSVFPFLPISHWKLRLVSPYMSIVAYRQQMQFKTSFDVYREISIEQIAALSKILRLLYESKTVGLRIEFEREDGKISKFSSAKVPFDIDPEVLANLDVCHQFALLVTHFGVSESTMVVPASVIAYRDTVATMSGFLNRTAGNVSVRIPLEGHDMSRRCAIVIPTSVLVNKSVLAAVFAVVGDPAIVDGAGDKPSMLQVEGDVRCLMKQVVPKSEWRYRDFCDRIRTMAASLEAEGLTVSIPRDVAESGARKTRKLRGPK
ncbi:hypothetical protein WME90_03830 [Sorangium sp. So ce375]|uniref:hypothetical protein n=1 Tax=Sorangium sp. So ce375 TaxID=3133306 RepID=UPI003F5BF022